jgi:hypothetical protein
MKAALVEPIDEFSVSNLGVGFDDKVTQISPPT